MSDSPTTWGLADACEAGTITTSTIDWVDVPVAEDDLILTVPKDALKIPFPQAGGRVMRAPCSYQEWLRAAKALGCCSLTIAWAKAVWNAAPKKQTPVELVITAADSMQMGTLEWLVRSEDRIDAQCADYGPDDWGRGAMKEWYIDPMMMEQSPITGCCNWGFVWPEGVKGREKLPWGPDHPDQPPGGRHVWTQIDYSQKKYDLALRWARRISDGSPVDLVEVECSKFPALATRLRHEYGTATVPA